MKGLGGLFKLAFLCGNSGDAHNSSFQVGSSAAYLQTGLFSAGRYLVLLFSWVLIITWLNLSNDVYDYDTGADQNKQESVVNIVGSRNVTQFAAIASLALGFVGFIWVTMQAGDIRFIVLVMYAVLCGYVYQKSYSSSISAGLNISDEMLNPLSITRQLVDQISLAMAYLVISKESNNLQFAWELSAQIHESQSLLSIAATRGLPLTIEESAKAIRSMALLLYQAQHLRYATMITKMKGQVHSLEEKSKSEAEKSSKFGQIAAEELPKGLYYLGLRLTMEWFNIPNLHKKQVSQKQLNDNNTLYHYCVFSDNILA